MDFNLLQVSIGGCKDKVQSFETNIFPVSFLFLNQKFYKEKTVYLKKMKKEEKPTFCFFVIIIFQTIVHQNKMLLYSFGAKVFVYETEKIFRGMEKENRTRRFLRQPVGGIIVCQC